MSSILTHKSKSTPTPTNIVHIMRINPNAKKQGLYYGVLTANRVICNSSVGVGVKSQKPLSFVDKVGAY
jgi:hypothetical protein